MNYYRKLLVVMLTAGLLAAAYPVSAATPQAVDSPAFLAQVASVLDTIQKTLRALAAAIQNLDRADDDVNGNAVATPSPAPSPTPSPTPYPTLSVPAILVPPASNPSLPTSAEPSINEAILKQLQATIEKLKAQVAAQKTAPPAAPQPQPTPATPRLNAPAAGSPRVVTTAAGTFGRTGDPNAPQQPEYVPGNAIIKFKDTEDVTFARGVDGIVTTSKPPLTQIFRTHRVSKAEKVFKNKSGAGLGKINLLTFPQDVAVTDVVAALARDPAVEYAEPNYIAYTAQVSTFTNRQTPNDPLYPQQWHLPKVSAPQAWAVTQGNPVPIAIIDTGVKWSHPDLAANIWRNPGEIPNNGIDDDRNGFIDDDKGWDFVETTLPCWPGEDCTTEDNNPDDFQGHGTHVSGIAAAVTNNNIGVAGVCQLCKIMNVRAGFAIVPYQGAPEPGGSLEYDDIVQALTYAADNGAKIISMSFGGGDGQIMRDAIAYAYSRGAVLVAAAGNQNTSVRVNAYPAVYPNVIAVSATDQNDQKADFSNFGSWVDISASGVDIFSTVIPGVQWGCRDTMNGYGLCSGTSMATPLVAGVVGLAFSRNPSLTQEQMKTLMHSSHDSLAISLYIGIGRTNAFKAVQPSTVSLALFNPSLRGIYVGSTLILNGTASGQNFSRYRVEVGSGMYPSVWTVIRGDTFTPVNNGVLARWTPQSASTPPGLYSLRLLVFDTNNRAWEDRAAMVIVDPTIVSGWPKQVSGENGGSPILVDADGDGDQEGFFQADRNNGWWNNTLFAIDHNGVPLPGGWPIDTPMSYGYTMRFSPAAANIDQDQQLEIVYARGVIPEGATYANKYYVYHADGTLQEGWPITMGTNYVNTIPASPHAGTAVIADLSSASGKEIVLTTAQNSMSSCGPESKVYVYTQNGQLVPGWPQPTQCGLYADLAVGDIDRDGNSEIIVPVGHPSGIVNGLFVFRNTGAPFPGWPRSMPLISSPVLADLDQNDDGKLEIVEAAAETGGIIRLYVFNHDGSIVPGWPQRFSPNSRSPAIGDIDGNGDLEIVFIGLDSLYQTVVYAVNHDGTVMNGWPVVIPRDYSPLGHAPSPIIVDLDGDGLMEVLISSNSDNNYLFGFHANGAAIAGFPKPLLAPVSWTVSPAAGDFNGNGLIDVFVLDSAGNMYLWEFSGPATPQALSGWPQFQHDAQHTGRYEPYIPQQ